MIALATSPSQSFTGGFVSFPCKFLGRRIFDKLSLVLFTHHGPNRVFKTCQSQAQSNKWCLDYFVVLGTVLVAGANYPPRKKTQLKEGRVYVGSQFEGTVHGDLEGRMERAETAGRMASTVRKLREMCAGAHPMKRSRPCAE